MPDHFLLVSSALSAVGRWIDLKTNQARGAGDGRNPVGNFRWNEEGNEISVR